MTTCDFETCKHKTTLIKFTCKCDNTYCLQHRFTDQHGCTFDHITSAREELRKRNQPVIAQKIIRI